MPSSNIKMNETPEWWTSSNTKHAGVVDRLAAIPNTADEQNTEVVDRLAAMSTLWTDGTQEWWTDWQQYQTQLTD